MPYLDPQQRNEALQHMKGAGALNFMIHDLVDQYLEANGRRYQSYNDVIGALECVKQEFYRRLVAPYEDNKRMENGDVRPYGK